MRSVVVADFGPHRGSLALLATPDTLPRLADLAVLLGTGTWVAVPVPEGTPDCDAVRATIPGRLDHTTTEWPHP